MVLRRTVMAVALALLLVSLYALGTIVSRAHSEHGRLDYMVAMYLQLGSWFGSEPLPHDQRDPQAMRAAGDALMLDMRAEPVAVAAVEDRLLPTSPPVPVRIYRPQVDAVSSPALVYYHGGGWTGGSIDTHDNVTRYLAAAAGVVVISVDWRRAPEHKFPAGLTDAYNAALWAWQNAEALDIDAARIAVGGDSSGGNFAAVVAQMARDRGEPAIAHQLLVYPATDLSDLDKPSYRKFASGFGLSTDSVLWYRSLYLDSAAQYSDPRVSPLFGELQSLPPATLLTAEFDVLNSDVELYEQALREAGVAVEQRRVDGVIHGFINADKMLPGRSREGLDYLARRLRENLNVVPVINPGL